MAYDQGLASRVSDILAGLPGFAAKKMFGGVGYMLRGNMACGVHSDDLIVRVGPADYEAALGEPGTKEFAMTGRPMKGWVLVSAESVQADHTLEDWVQRGVDFTLSLPPK